MDADREWLRERGLWAGVRTYDDATKAWLARSGHYLQKPPPGALFAIGLEELVPGLFGQVPSGALVGLIVVGRPVAPGLPQDGSWADLQRIVLNDGLPYGTASRVIGVAIAEARNRGKIETVIAYHDRTRHTGCIYRKAGFRKDVSERVRGGWDSRPNRERSAAAGKAPKRRWRFDITESPAPSPVDLHPRRA